MDLFLHQVLAGVATGSIYACLALAIVMIYQTINHLNFAQGEMAMFSTFIAWQLMQWGAPYWVAFAGTAAFSFVAGIAIERVLFRPIHNAPVLSHLVVFIALFAILNSLAGSIWDYNVKSFPTPFGSRSLFGNGVMSSHDAGMMAVTLAMLVLLYVFFRHTRIGLAMRAAAENPESARLSGIRVGWMIALGWGMAAAIGAVAGVMIAPVVFLDPNMMNSILVYGFAGAVVGGARVVAKNLETNAVKETTTSGEGAFRFPLLPTGNYEVTVEKPGFAKYRQGPIVLRLNQAADLTVRLEVSGTTDTVVVMTDAPLINTTNAEIGVNFDAKRIAELPLSTNRNVMNLAASIPGVSQVSNGNSQFGSSGNQGTESGGLQFAANGMRTRSNAFIIDGQDSYGPSTGGLVQSMNNPDIISEVRKGARCDVHVSTWYASITDADIFLSTLVLGEIRKGVELARPRDAGKAAALERWLRDVEAAFDGRVLGICNAVSDQWGRISAIKPVPVIDGLLAATALTHNLTLVTRNDRDVAGLGTTVLNPFKVAK